MKNKINKSIDKNFLSYLNSEYKKLKNIQSFFNTSEYYSKIVDNDFEKYFIDSNVINDIHNNLYTKQRKIEEFFDENNEVLNSIKNISSIRSNNNNTNENLLNIRNSLNNKR
ncbi:Uncharacterised protein [Metamycoplasma cloacale]|uniref:Uncharacterized protein n=1 Tax=Metamycoplasma cloacale TaxID=92401 RepID=A0A2Z4LM85_9BACT|nr:hypothetical protein [Metamycoplasma cloacale]AWX42846.1 hypothetical protein DK849_02095 [Metamycoplasma cloacale]VEU79333.1 Uncharacterised protein [Metamycoplasma cloacale]